MLSPKTGRRHLFSAKSAVHADCDRCAKTFQYGALVYRCEVCWIVCHAECRELAIVPCIARGTPSPKSRKGKLADFVPKESPMIPGLIVHCANEIESRGLTSIGLYRIPGAAAQVSQLYDKFLYSGVAIPDLSVEDINVLASCVKKLLLHLSDPIIPSSARAKFIEAGNMTYNGRDASSLFQKSIAKLPQPNRDTLAFLILHLQKVANYSTVNKMTITNLATVFGPTVVGATPISVASTPTNLEDARQELPRMGAVMKGLLGLPSEYWASFLSEERENTAAANSPSAFDNSIQGASAYAVTPDGNGTTPKFFGLKKRNQRVSFNSPGK